MNKLKSFLITLILVIFVMLITACSESIEGTWYLVGEDPDDADNQLLLIEDGTCIMDDEAGTWTMSDNRLILISPYDGGITLDESEYDGVKSFISFEDRDIQFIKNYDKAKEVYDEIVAAEEERERKAKEEKTNYLMNNLAGQYDYGNYWKVIEKDSVYIILNDEDNTYNIYCDTNENGDPLTESGTYYVDTNSLDEVHIGYYRMDIIFTAEEASSDVSDYKKANDYADGESALQGIKANVLRDESGEGETEIYLSVETGMGSVSGDNYIPSGKYHKTK